MLGMLTDTAKRPPATAVEQRMMNVEDVEDVEKRL